MVIWRKIVIDDGNVASVARAVGAVVISPALQRGVSAPTIYPESRRDGAKSSHNACSNEINHLQPLRRFARIRQSHRHFADHFMHSATLKLSTSVRAGRAEMRENVQPTTEHSENIIPYSLFPIPYSLFHPPYPPYFCETVKL